MILPVRKESIVHTDTPEELSAKIKYVTGKRKSGDYRSRPVKFVGIVNENAFVITRFVNRPENFAPLIKGKIQSVARGSLISMRYTLQFSSRMFVIFWTVTTLLFALFLWFIQSNVKLGLISLTFLIVNIVVTHISFQRQYKKVRKVLMDVLDA